MDDVRPLVQRDRRFLEVTAAGAVALAMAAAGPAQAQTRAGALGQPARHDRGAGRLSLLGGAEVRLFRRPRRPRSSPGRWRRPRRSSSSTRTRPTWAIPRPACSRSGSSRASRWSRSGTWVPTTCSASPSRRARSRPARPSLAGKTILLGSIGWKSICDPELAQLGVDPASVQYAEAGAFWGQALLQGQGDAALSWEGLRAQWTGQGLDVRLPPALRVLEAAGQQLRHPAQRLRRCRAGGRSTSSICAAGPWGWSSASTTRARRPRS